ncbi:MAG: DNA recombination protein RmuC [Thalassolituus oleivorans]|uniref:DNA recombination protein RmuC n=1 Tax=Thalassolituus oleivorans TaxID=187493 RepID=UPI001B6060F5|nr:DNA recombination protein RmuC [Thalassolituus oleivorans]MBQ0728945.1 DNA recombination protein RmuC [Thalassolituus oleivorans]
MPEWFNQYPSQIVIALLALGFIAAGGLGYLLRGRKVARLSEEFQRVQQALMQTQQEYQQEQERYQVLQQASQQQLAQLQSYQVEEARQQERVIAQQQQLAQQQAKLEQLEHTLRDIQQQLQQSQTQLATEQETRLQQQQHAEEKLALLQSNKEEMLKEFELLSQKIFEQKTKQFTEQNRVGLDTVLTPFKEQLEGLKKKVEDVHIDDVRDRTTLKAQITELHQLNKQMTTEAHALTTALRGEKKTQGNWGEMVLERVLERSGLRAGEEYQREQSMQNDEGQRFRPDVIINLPEGKHIVIDSKVSLNAYTDYVAAETDEARALAARRHTDAIRNHIRSLSEKAYQQLEGINSPDFVFLFMPIEPAFMLAFQHDESLFNDAFERRIVVVTPTTLLATLRTVASIWAIERRNKSTEKLAEQAGKIYDKLTIVVDRMETLGKQLNTAQGTWDSAWNSLKTGRGNLFSQADQFLKLGVRVKKELAKNLVEEANDEHDLHESMRLKPLVVDSDD